jgi:hypothetical protein
VDKPAFPSAQPLSLFSWVAIFVRDPTVAVAESGENTVSFSDSVIGSLVRSIAVGKCKCCNHCHVFDETDRALEDLHSAKAMRRRILHRFNNLETNVQKTIVTVNPSAHSGFVDRNSTKALK